MTTESTLQNQIRIAASAIGWTLWRNNRGVDERRASDGRILRVVRYGLANESKAIGDRIKSADLIGWDSQGRFVSVEVKTPTGIIHPSQLVWRDLVRRDGGIGIIATRIEDLIT